MKRREKGSFTTFLLGLIISFSLLSMVMIIYYSFVDFLENEKSYEQTQEASRFNSTYVSQSIDNDSNPNVNAVSQSEVDTEDLYLIPLGEIFGIKLYTDGIIVTALSDIYSDGQYVSPAEEAGIKAGDYITHINGEKVRDNSHFTEILAKYMPNEVKVTVNRNGEIMEFNLQPIFDSTAYRCGMWIRDSAAGIGTLTYVDPTTGNFAGLGHGICDPDTGSIMSLKDGNPSPITISSVEKAASGSPGKINGFFSNDSSLGILTDNNDTGIFGVLNEIPQAEKIPVADKDEIETGEAEILSTVSNDGAQSFNVVIESIPNPDEQIKNLVVKITDERLMAITGGIIQGMSGTPIIKDGEFVGAISHVFIDDPTRGYGIFIHNMLESAS